MNPTDSPRFHLRLRWMKGCPDCGSRQVRHSMFSQAIVNGKGYDEFVCMECRHKEVESDLPDRAE